MLCGTAFKNKGVQPLLDAVLDYLPSPLDVPGISIAAGEGEEDGEHSNRRRIKADPAAPFAGLAFKIINDKYGTLTFVRVYAGTLKSGDTVLNTTKDHRERIGRMFQMHADKRQEIKEVEAGDIVAFVGLKDTGTGDTLASPQDPVVLERMAFPVPVIDISVEPKTKDFDRENEHRPAEAGRRGSQPAAAHRPGDRADHPVRHGRAAPGDHHRPAAARIRRGGEYWRPAGRLSRDDHPAAHRNLYPPQADRRRRPVRRSENHVRAVGAQRGVVFENAVVGGSVPKEYIPAVEKGIRLQADTGVLAGFPTVDFKYTLIDGKYHDVDSSALAFEIAAKACFRDGMKKSGPILLEPMMDVEVTTPQDHVGDVVGDLNRRRGMIQNQESSGSDDHRAGPCSPEGDVRLYLGPAEHDQGTRLVHDAVPPL